MGDLHTAEQLFLKYASLLSSFLLVVQGLRATFCRTHQKGEGRNNIYFLESVSLLRFSMTKLMYNMYNLNDTSKRTWFKDTC